MNVENEQPIPVRATADGAGEQGFRRAWAIIRSTLHWLLSAAFFFPVCSSLVVLGIFVDPRKNDGAQRMLCRVVMKLAGAKLVVRRAPGFDPAAHLLSSLQSRQLVRSVRPVRHGSAVFSRIGAGIAFSDSRIWLDDETFRQCSGAGRQPSL